MKIAIDISPLSTGHKVRGTGFYLENLKKSLLKYHSDIEYNFFTEYREIKPDTDLVHFPYFDPFFLTLPFTKKYKTVVTVHDLTPILYPKHFPAGIKGNIMWKIQKHNLLKTDAIITDSVVSKKDIIEILKIDESKISHIYLAAGEEFRSIKNQVSSIKEIKDKYSLPERFVLYVGDVTWNKNLPTLIEAIKEINLTLVMVGKAIAQTDIDPKNIWNKDLIDVQRMTKDDKRFIKLGFVPTDDLVKLYNAATVFVFPSIYEGFGLPVVEAMQCGCPVVLSGTGCLRELGGSAVYYVDPSDPDSIANGIGEVFYSPELQKKYSNRGLEQARKFSWRKTAEETVKVYKDIMTRG